MSKILSGPVPLRNKTADSSQGPYANKPVDSRGVNGRLVSSVMDGYALYRAAFHPPLMLSNRAKSSQVGLDLTCYRSDRTYGPGCAANEVGSNDNLRALPPLMCDSGLRISATDSPLPMSQIGKGLIVATKAAVAYVRRLRCYIRRERDIARSISMLASLDDRTLDDIGIHRSQIPQAARYGVDESGRIRWPGR
jgi:uncharacterized protein YjiS (DUF1127 family)